MYLLVSRLTSNRKHKIYQVPTPLMHYQSRDVKRIRTQENVDAETRNLERLQRKWKNNPLYATIES